MWLEDMFRDKRHSWAFIYLKYCAFALSGMVAVVMESERIVL